MVAAGRSGNYVIDQLVMVYDLRMMRSLPPISFPPGPYMLRFHPTFASTLVVAAQHGVFQFAEVGMTSTMPQSFHVRILPADPTNAWRSLTRARRVAGAAPSPRRTTRPGR